MERQRAEEMGGEIVSDAVLIEVDRKIDGLARGRRVAHLDFDAALSALRMVVSDEVCPAPDAMHNAFEREPTIAAAVTAAMRRFAAVARELDELRAGCTSERVLNDA